MTGDHFSDDELRAAIEEALAGQFNDDIDNPDPGTITTKEMCRLHSMGDDAARNFLKQMVRDGFLSFDWVKRRDHWTGKPTKRRGFRLCVAGGGEGEIGEI